MKFMYTLLMTACIATLGNAAPAKPKGLGDPGQLKSISMVNQSAIDGLATLAGRSASLQVVVTGEYSTGQQRDLTGDVAYTTTPEGIVHVDSAGMITPLKEGKVTLTAKAKSGPSANLTLAVTSLVKDKAINFPNQVTPVFTKFGCNSGGCHGKSGGQNGFQLSLLGFEPTEDYEALVMEARGRRLFPAAPERSLLLVKATGEMPHGGGKRLTKGSPHYNVILRWIAQGTPYGKDTDPVVQRIEVFPKDRLMQLESKQQLSVVAHFSDGSIEDVTRMTQFETNDKDLAIVDETGLVETKNVAGSLSIMVRYQSQVDVFRAMVPLGVEVTKLPEEKNFVDTLVFKQLKKLGLPPSQLCDDSTFIRRATLDVCGRLPTKEESEKFLADKSKDKHAKLIDRLLESEDYGYYFANKWSAILRNRRDNAKDTNGPTFAFHKWIVESFNKNKPYDKFVREIITATGKEISTPPVAWYRQVKDEALQVEDTAQLFLGQRIQCARCHHHPFEKWSQEDYYGLAAFFSQVEYKKPPKQKGKKKGPPPPIEVAHKPGTAQAKNPKTNKNVLPTGLGNETLTIDKNQDPRTFLVDWMVKKDNPFFAKSLANRYWKHFFSRGLVDPEDDMRVTNPATNPELLEALGKHFVESNFDLKQLVRTICTSNTYRLSAVPNEYNADDRQNYSRFVPRRMNAEVLLDAIDTVTAVPTRFSGMPNGTTAVRLPDNMVNSYFLSVFGRPDATSACECERSDEPSLAQCLHMMNSSEILQKVSGKRAQDFAKDKKRTHEERIRELFLIALSREPDEQEMTALMGHIEKKGDKGVKEAYEDIVWAVISTKEFLFNH